MLSKVLLTVLFQYFVISKSIKSLLIFKNINNFKLNNNVQEIPRIIIDLRDLKIYFRPLEKGPTPLYPTPQSPSKTLEFANRSVNVPVLKYMIGTSFETVVFLSEKCDHLVIILENILNYARFNKIQICFSGIEIDTNLIELLYGKKFSNIEILSYGKTFNYKVFKPFKIIASNTSSNLRNVEKTTLNIGFIESSIRSIVFPTPGKFGGYFFWILKGFCDYINATMEIHQKSFQNYMDLTDQLYEDKLDFITEMSMFVNMESISDIIEIIQYTTMVPYPKPIDRSLYILEPFTWEVWILLLFSIFYLGLSLALVFGKRDFLECVSMALKGLLAQSISQKPKQNQSIFKINILGITVLGFCFTIFYITFLGSFLTSPPYNKPLDTWESVFQSNLKIGIIDKEYREFLNFNKNDPKLDYYKPLKYIDFVKRRLNFNNDIGYTVSTDSWEYFFQPAQEFFRVKKFILSKEAIAPSMIFLNMQSNSIFKNEFNKYLHRIRDVGLYKFWCKNSFIENLQSKNISRIREESPVRVLTLEYFDYVFIGIFFGYIFALVIFLVEIIYLC